MSNPNSVQDSGHILVVDDNKINRMMLQKMLTDQGHRVTQAVDGIQALDYLQNPSKEGVDVILLDILMPELDGYQLLEKIKQDPKLHYLPVIMISALDELDSVVRCIEIGATDYLTKPVQRTLLRARLNASLAEKHLRDLELEYLEQVGHVIGAAEAVQENAYAPESLTTVAAREDALGNLARVFQRMAREVHLREQRLKQQLEQLRLDMEEMKRALKEPLSVYLPMDRRHALVRGESLPDRASGSALFADISGFTPLTNAFVQELGRTRGAEEMTRLINQVFDALVEEVHFYRGSVISFSGDAMTCWFDEDEGMRGAACAVLLQLAMTRFETLITPLGSPPSLSIKVAVVSGTVRRFLLGDPADQIIEAIAGHKLDLLAAAEHLARKGEIIVDGTIAERFREKLKVEEWRTTAETEQAFAVISGLNQPVIPTPWPVLPADALSQAVCRPWLHPAVFERVRSSAKQFLAELRPAAALFLQFRGIDFDRDEMAGDRLDAYIRWVQSVISQHEGAILQITFGDKGSYLYAAFGAPLAHTDDAVRAVRATMTLQTIPAELNYITGVQIGVTYGQMRVGAYGGSARRTYGVIGNRTNLAARLMQVAEQGILCDQAIYEAAQGEITFEVLPPIRVKGRTESFPVYRPIGESFTPLELSALISRIDRLSPVEQSALKLASAIGIEFDRDLLAAIFPSEEEKIHLSTTLQMLEKAGLITPHTGTTYQFSHLGVLEAAYNAMLYAQRRPLHRQIAEWMETNPTDLVPFEETLGYHWQNAGDPAKALRYLEKAGQRARENGDMEKAEQLFQQCLALEAQSSVSQA
ncbi:MAG TPA: response regulator [Anaerolineales bacterium]|nr:response regulator [Anaerolineales bacterium]